MGNPAEKTTIAPGKRMFRENHTSRQDFFSVIFQPDCPCHAQPSVFNGRTDAVTFPPGKVMSYQIQYEPDNGLVLVTVPSTIEPVAAQEVTRRAIRLVKEHRASRILCNAGEMELAMSIPELYQIIEIYHAEGLPYGTRIAIVAPQKREDIEKLEIFGIAALNRGYTVRLFGQMEQARQWLHHDARPKPDGLGGGS
jgi:hypothetical protein